jgi:ribosomal 50S subunit-recycling heat shock protein
MARLDRVLKFLCVLKTRSQAALACKEGRVEVDGRLGRPSQEVRRGQTILLRDRLGIQETEVTILDVPDKQLSKKDVGVYARIAVRRGDPL